jgi:hypothetical protein
MSPILSGDSHSQNHSLSFVNLETPSCNHTQGVDAGSQVNSPQIKTAPMVRRSLSSTRRELFQVNSSLKRNQDEHHKLLEKSQNLKVKIREKDTKIAELNNKCKQVIADSKQVKVLQKELEQSQNQIRDLTGTIEEMLDDQNMMVESMNNSVDNKKRIHALQEAKRRACKKLSDVRLHIKNICSSIVTGSGDISCFEDLCTSLLELTSLDTQSVTVLKELRSSLSAPLPMKDGGVYKEHIALLSMQLQLLGVPQNTVGDVMNECSERLHNRSLSHRPSARTAGRMIRQGGILSEAQLALTLTDTSSAGHRVGQDTTTRGGVEHVATGWAGRTPDDKVFNMQSRVEWLPNHIAETQVNHVMRIMERSNNLLKSLDLEPECRASLAYVIDFMGDHVNSKLVRLLRDQHLVDLEQVIENGVLTDDDREVFSELFNSACQMHSGAKISRSFYEGMRAIEPPGIEKTFGKYGIRRGAGSTFDSVGARVVEFASCQFSPDQSNTSDFNWSGVFRGWCDDNGKPYIKLDYVNKNRHYRHELNSGRMIQLTNTILEFYQEQLSTRDDGALLRNKDQIVLECLQSDEVRSQLTAADALATTFFKPFMSMLKAKETDVVTVGPFIRRAYEFLNQAGNDENFARKVLSGDAMLYEGEHLRRDGKDFRTKPVGFAVYGQSVEARSIAYLMAGCQAGAKGLKHISAEYFHGGHYFEPSLKQSRLLSGFDAHSDRLESNLGQFSQQRAKMPHARLQTISSHVVMRANKTVTAIDRDERLMSCLAKVRKLEREESKVTIRQQLASVSAANKPHREKLRMALEKRQNTRAARRNKVKGQVERDGICRSTGDVDGLCLKYRKKLAQRQVLRQHITFFKNIKKDAPKYLFKFSKNRKQLTNEELVKNLKRLVAESGEDGTVLSLSQVSAEDTHQSVQATASVSAPACLSETANLPAPEKKKKKSRRASKVEPFVFKQPDAWVVTLFEDRWYPGRVDKIYDENTADVTYLHPLKGTLDCQHFMWPNKPDKDEVEMYRTNAKAVIYSNFTIQSVGHPVRYYTLTKFKDISKVYRKLT